MNTQQKRNNGSASETIGPLEKAQKTQTPKGDLASMKASHAAFLQRQQRAIDKGIMEQRRYSTALNLIDQHYNRKGKSQVVTYSRAGPDHAPKFSCTIKILIPTGFYECSPQHGTTKKEARERASADLLEFIADEVDYSKMPNGAWIKDLTQEGIESNPGPIVFSQADAWTGTSGQLVTLNSTQATQANAIQMSVVNTAGQNGDERVSFNVIKPSGSMIFRLSQGQQSDIIYIPSGESASISVEITPASATVRWYITQLRGAGLTQLTAVTNFPSVQNTNVLNYPPLQNVNLSSVSTTSPIDTNITNSSLPIELTSGESLSVSLEQDSLPLWVTTYGPGRIENGYVARPNTPEDLLSDGDIESNPGPTDIIDPFMAFSKVPVVVTTSRNDEDKAGQANVFGAFMDEATTSGSFSAAMEQYLNGSESLETIESQHSIDISTAHTDDSTLYRNQHLDKLARHKSDVGRYFKYTVCVLGFPIDNEYNLLDEEFLGFEKSYNYDPSAHKQTTKRAPHPSQEQTQPARPVRPLPREQPTSTPVDLKKQKEEVVKRIANKFSGVGREKLISWLRVGKPSRGFVKVVANATFGAGWELLNDWDQYHLAVYCYLENVRDELQAVVLCTLDTQKGKYLKMENHSADLQAAKLHNKLMHAYNGNPLAALMEEVDQTDSWIKALMGDVRHLPRYTGVEAQATITNIVGQLNPNQSLLFEQDRLRGNIVRSDNEIVTNACVTLPSTNLIPRGYYIPGEAPPYQYDPYGARVTEINVAEYYSNPVQPTKLVEFVTLNVSNQQTSTWRKDNTMLSGFNMFDVINEAVNVLQKGLSLEEMILRLELMHGILSLRTSWRAIPASSWSVINPSFVPSRVDPVFEVNTSPIQGEDCGGNNPVYPWGGDSGTVAFHQTPATVPKDELESVVYMPSALLQAGRDGTEAIALFVASLTEYPACVPVLKQRGVFRVDSANTSPEIDVPFVPTEAWTRVPGRKVLHVILPRKVAQGNPTSRSEANGSLVVRPRFGPTATSEYGANSLMDANAVNAPYVSYKLTHYIYSWWQHFDITTIKNYIGRLGVAVGVSDVCYAMREVRNNLCQHFPAMYLRNINGTSNKPVYPTVPIQEKFLNQMHVRYYANHTVVSEPESRREGEVNYVKFPIFAPVSADYRIFETNLAVWNKVCLGLAMADNLKGEPLPLIPAHLGSYNSHFWDRLEIIASAASWSVFYSLSGMTTKAWDEGYSTTQNRWIQTRVRNTFCTAQVNGTIVPAVYEPMLRKIMEHMYERSPSLVHTSVSATPIELSHFGRWLPAQSYAQTFHFTDPDVNPNYEPEPFRCYTPVILPDIWIQYPAKNLFQFACSFPPPFGRDSLQGYAQGTDFVVHRNNRAGLVSPYIERSVLAVYPLNKGPNPDDKIKWNTRLWFLNPNMQAGNYSGDPTDELFPYIGTEDQQSGLYRPAGRMIFDFPGDNQAIGLPTMNTMCFPEMSANGDRIVPYLKANESTISVQACNRAQRLFATVWLLGNVYAEPSIQNYDYTGVDDCFAQIVKKELSDFREAASVDNTVISPDNLVMEAVDTVKSTNLLSQSTPIEQPATVVDSSA